MSSNIAFTPHPPKSSDMVSFATVNFARFLYNNISGIGVAGKYHIDKKMIEDVVKVIL